MSQEIAEIAPIQRIEHPARTAAKLALDVAHAAVEAALRDCRGDPLDGPLWRAQRQLTQTAEAFARIDSPLTAAERYVADAQEAMRQERAELAEQRKAVDADLAEYDRVGRENDRLRHEVASLVARNGGMAQRISELTIELNRLRQARPVPSPVEPPSPSVVAPTTGEPEMRAHEPRKPAQDICPHCNVPRSSCGHLTDDQWERRLRNARRDVERPVPRVISGRRRVG